MGVFTSNRTSLGNDIDFVADESYVGELGSSRIMIENAKNDLALFTGIIKNDFNETQLALESAGAEDVEAVNESLIALQEANLRSMADSVIAFIKKVAAKIKGLILSFVTKVGATLTRSNKELVKKYSSKIGRRDLSKMKYKWSKPKKDVTTTLATVGAATAAVSKIFAGAVFKGSDAVSKTDNDGDLKDELLSSAVGFSTSFSSYRKDSFENSFEDKEEVTGLADATLTSIKNTLTSCDKALNNMKASVPKVDKVFNDAIKAVKSAKGKVDKATADTTAKTAGAKLDDDHSLAYNTSGKGLNTASKALANIQKAVSASQQVFSTIIAESIKEFKFHIGQCRRVFVQAASYSERRSTEENAVFLDAVGESVEYEFESDMHELEVSALQ